MEPTTAVAATAAVAPIITHNFLAILIVAVILLVYFHMPSFTKQKTRPDSAEFNVISGEWYTKRNGGISTLTFAPSGDALTIQFDDKDPVDAEKMQHYAFWDPFYDGRFTFSAVMPNGKLRDAVAKVRNNEMTLHVVRENTITYFKDRRRAEALDD